MCAGRVISAGQDSDAMVQGLLLEAVDAVRQASGLIVDAKASAALDGHADDIARLAQAQASAVGS